MPIGFTVVSSRHEQQEDHRHQLILAEPLPASACTRALTRSSRGCSDETRQPPDVTEERHDARDDLHHPPAGRVAETMERDQVEPVAVASARRAPRR
ncbi:MAG: hypothetical protein WKF75_02010 [Singulisphaera sp.]